MTPGPVKPLQSLPTQTTPWHLQETYKSLITISVECLKMLAIVNGGAAVAVLTYLGNLASHAASGQPTIHITPALMCYCGGLFAAILAFVLGYVVQLHTMRKSHCARAKPSAEDISGCCGPLLHLCCWQLSHSQQDACLQQMLLGV